MCLYTHKHTHERVQLVKGFTKCKECDHKYRVTRSVQLLHCALVVVCFSLITRSVQLLHCALVVVCCSLIDIKQRSLY